MPILIVGEVIVDFTLRKKNEEPKLRLGGIVHAARGLWAANLEYAVAAIFPKYLFNQLENYLKAHGCTELIWLGEVLGAPNIITIDDQIEVGNQGYEELLREEKTVTIFDQDKKLHKFTEVLIFPGHYDVNAIRRLFSNTAYFSFDIAYDITDLSKLSRYKSHIRTIIISTSSALFLQSGSKNLEELQEVIKQYSPERFLLKENRGGSRLFDLSVNEVIEIPAELGITVNSVGVGDVYSAILVAQHKLGWKNAVWRAARAATYYSQTTFPDDFKRDYQRDLLMSVETLETLGGTFLPWHDRQKFSIYLAAPDFSDFHKPEIELAVSSLTYHNFNLRRPITENGELTRPASAHALKMTYLNDLELIKESSIIFAIPLERDPGTLVEIGLAIALGKPVITFDPRLENNNTMVIAGSKCYSTKLDDCLNAVFQNLSDLRRAK